MFDLHDPNLSARISSIAGDKYRLTLEYPCDPVYRDRVLAALSDLLKPAETETQQKRRGRPRKEGGKTE